MTYAEAVALGIAVPMADLDLPICEDATDASDGGFRTAEEAEEAIDDNAEAACQVDPELGLYSKRPLRKPATSTGQSGAVAPVPPGTILTYDEAVARGLPVPEFIPALPICPDIVSPGFKTAEEMEAAVDDNAPATCQADYRKGVITVRKARARPS